MRDSYKEIRIRERIVIERRCVQNVATEIRLYKRNSYIIDIIGEFIEKNGNVNMLTE